MLTQRQQKLNRLFRETISELLLRRLKDPRLGMISISEVVVSADLSEAKVFVVLSGSEEERLQSMEGLQSAAGHIRSQLGKIIRLRRVPELEFVRDTAQERGDRILDLIDKVSRERHENDEGEE